MNQQKKLRILLNGDSNMVGEELRDRTLSLGNQLCQMLDGEPVPLALSGASNDRIYDTTMDYVRSGEPVDFVVIGWSEMCRVQWFFEEHGEYKFHEVNNLGVGRQTFPEEFKLRLEHWASTSENLEHRIGLSHYWHERIFNLHRYLQYKQIPHLFFHAFHDFKIHQSQYQLDWNNCFMDPYSWDNTYVHWAARNGYKEITPGWFHYEPSAQLAWAQRMYNYIKTHNLL